MKTKIIRFVLAIGVIAVLIGGLLILYAKTSAVDAEKKAEVEGYLKQLKQVDAEWNVDVLKSRMEINKHYDPLTSPLPTLLALQERLGAEVVAVKEPGTEKALNELKAVIAEKVDLVDRDTRHRRPVQGAEFDPQEFASIHSDGSRRVAHAST